MDILNEIAQRYAALKRRRMLADARATMKLYGHDVSGLSGDELETLLIEMNRKLQHGLRAIAVSADQASMALSRLGRAAAMK
jgi:hypothetical protein